jgi:redox-sensitive bicupin YhaK (pirin superfamily)
VGAWCFLDHFGPVDGPAATMAVGPHSHIGLQTVTWLVAGEVLHRDSLGSEQPIRPGQLNLMTAGRGVSHAEESPVGAPAELHGAQLWVALPESTRHGPPAFEHHADLPRAEPASGVVVTVLVGSLAGVRSPARADSPLVGAQVMVAAGASGVLDLAPHFEHAVVVLDGRVDVGEGVLGPGELGYLAPHRDELPVRSVDGATLLVVGGEPFDDEIHMWWNFVARSRAEIEAAADDWNGGGEARFGRVASGLARIAAPQPPWRSSR